MQRLQRIQTAINTALTVKYADPEKYHQYVLSRGRDRLAKHIAKMAKQHISINQPNALDLGAGTGIISAELQKEGFAVTPTDADAAMVRALTEKLPGITAEILDINQPFKLNNMSFDIVTTVWANRYITRRGLSIYLNEVYRVLTPGGMFIWPLFNTEYVLWKLRAGLRQPTSANALVKRLELVGFVEVHIDREHKQKNRVLKDLPNWAYPLYIIAKKPGNI